MKGLWKENLGGWHKDTKRKTQKRKHSLRDNGRIILKRYNSWREPRKTQDDTFRIELQMENIKEPDIYKKSGFVDTYRIEISKIVGSKLVGNYLEDVYSYSIRTAYEYFGVWYDEYTNEEITGNIKKLSFLYREEIEYPEPVNISKNRRSYGSFDANEIYIYGKFISQWKRSTFYNDGKRRKYAQKYASSRDRQNIRKWLSDEDWDAEIKTHALSKSILWEIW